jgi:hypothetical protein
MLTKASEELCGSLTRQSGGSSSFCTQRREKRFAAISAVTSGLSVAPGAAGYAQSRRSDEVDIEK